MKSDTKQKTATLLALLAAGAMMCAACFATDPPSKKATASQEKRALDVNNPIRKISGMMKTAADLLGKFETGIPAQDEQKKILRELDILIQMAQQAQNQSSSQNEQNENEDEPREQQPQNTGGENTGSRPMETERDVFRAGRPRLGPDAPDLREMWGKLPDAPRGQVLQLLCEKLPLKYQQLLYWYTKALSEKK